MSKPDEIPRDIWNAAAEAHGLSPDSGLPGHRVRIIRTARAIAAERERCATSAAIHSQYPITTDFDRGYAVARKDAAAEIRKGD